MIFNRILLYRFRFRALSLGTVGKSNEFVFPDRNMLTFLKGSRSAGQILQQRCLQKQGLRPPLFGGYNTCFRAPLHLYELCIFRCCWCQRKEFGGNKELGLQNLNPNVDGIFVIAMLLHELPRFAIFVFWENLEKSKRYFDVYGRFSKLIASSVSAVACA